MLKDSFLLVAVTRFRNANGCCCSEQPLRQDFRESLLYTSKLSLKPDGHQVAAFVCAEIALSTHSDHSVFGRKSLLSGRLQPVNSTRSMTAENESRHYGRFGVFSLFVDAFLILAAQPHLR